MPVLVTGFSQVVQGGDILQVFGGIDLAEAQAREFTSVKSRRSLKSFEGASLEMLMNRLKTGTLKQLKIVLKADTNGSLEAIKNALLKLSTEETQVTIIHSAVGDINDNDVLMAGTSQAILIGYNVSVFGNTKHMLSGSKIEFINKSVIYHILERIEAIITGMVDTRYDDVDLGIAKVKAIFYTGKDRLIIGL